MTAPPWGHKPPPVSDRRAYWSSAPAEPSARCAYWVRRWREATWRSNRWLRRECADCQAAMLGVWEWEARFVMLPLECVVIDGESPEDVARWCGAWTETAPGPYWRLLEERSRPGRAPVRDQVAELADLMAPIEAGRPRSLTEAVTRTLGRLAV